MDPLTQILFAAAATLTIAMLIYRVLELEAAERPAVPETPEPAPAAQREFSPEMLLSPITLIMAECELARRKTGADHIAHIDRHARRAAEILGRHCAETPTVPERRFVAPAPCLRAAVDYFAGLALERGVHVHFYAESTPDVLVAPPLLSHALRHLVRAAIEAAPAGSGDVTVAAGEIDGVVHFAVADDGPGLEAHELAAIFDPAAESLGYAVVSTLAGVFGGDFVIETGPGVGTRAILKIPGVIAGVEVAQTPRPEPVALLVS